MGKAVTIAGDTISYKTTRNVYKAVKRYDHQQLDEFCTRICNTAYKRGYSAGQEDARETASRDEREKAVEMILDAVGNVKGVGPALDVKIREAVYEKMGYPLGR